MCANDDEEENEQSKSWLDWIGFGLKVIVLFVVVSIVIVTPVMMVANSDRGVCMASPLIFHPQSLQNRDVHMDKKCTFLLMIP